jgi:pimeloyl-ACP methyl ester carboxylesterase
LLTGLFNVASAKNSFFEPTDCPEGYSETKVTWECGYLSVPEDHAKPEGKTIKLFVAKAKSQNSHPASDPVLFAGTSIGGKIIELGSVLFPLYPNFTKDRDFIMYDHRGVGKSIPALECPEIEQMYQSSFGKDLSEEDYVAQEVAAINTCQARLGAKHDLNVYNTMQTAMDMEAIRIALGYKTINIFSYSYSTSVALTYMKLYPDNIRSVILDSNVPGDMWLYSSLMSAQAHSLDALFDNCKADKQCNTAYPNLKNTYSALIRRLDQEPIKVTIADPHCAHESSCDPIVISVNENHLSGYIVNELFAADPVTRLPKVIHDTYHKNYAPLVDMINAQQSGGHVIGTSWGRYYSTVCHDNVYSENQATIEKSMASYPWIGLPYYQPVVLGSEIKSICDKWVTKTASPESSLPVSSDIPTLILQGEYDPYSPPSWGRHVYETLSNAYLYVFPGLTHVPILGEECPISIAEQFISNPNKEPDSSCLMKPRN